MIYEFFFYCYYNVTILLPLQWQGKVNCWYDVESKLHGVCASIHLILFRLRIENMIFSVVVIIFFFGRREKELSSSAERMNTPVFLGDEEKEKLCE